MRLLAVVLLLFVIVSCQPKIKGEVELKAKPIEVNHHIALDIDKLEAYYLAECEDEFPAYTDTQLQECADEKLGKFINDFTHNI